MRINVDSVKAKKREKDEGYPLQLLPSPLLASWQVGKLANKNEDGRFHLFNWPFYPLFLFTAFYFDVRVL